MNLIKKFNLSLIVLLLSLSATTLAYCLPQDEQVVSGSATFDRSTSDTLNVNTPSDKLIVNYSSFDIAQQETVNFNQPSSQAVALNRVTEGTNPTQILGSLNANGRIFIINQNGVLFGSGSRVDAAALVASTLDIRNEDFLTGKYNFFKTGVNTYIINNGNITVRNGGYVCLLSQAVDNQGSIQASLGTIVLASGEKMTLALDDMNDISVAIDGGVKEAVFGPDGKKIDSAVKNSGTISANGGKVILTAKVLNNVFDYAVNNTGVIEAKNVIEHDGVIELTAEGGPIINTGRIEAGEVKIEAKDSRFINKGDVISRGIIGFKALNIELFDTGSVISDVKITLGVDTIKVTYSSGKSPFTMDPESLVDVTTGAILQAPEVRVTAKKLGTTDSPLSINAKYTFIYRVDGDIDISDSLGIGTSILLRGPPEGFGAIIYNRDTNLTLNANKVILSGTDPIYLYGNITFSNFECTIPNKEIYFEAGKTYTILGDLVLTGGYGQLLKLRSSVEGQRWNIDPRGSRNLEFISIKDSYNINPAEIVAIRSNKEENCFNWDPTTIWTGNGANNNWSTGGNWDTGVTPPTGNDVLFDGVASNKDATVDAGFNGTNTINSLTINGYTGTITLGVNLVISNDLTVSSGTLNISTFSPTAGVVTLSGGTINGTTGVLTGTSYSVNSGIISARLGGSGTLTKDTSGTVTLTTANAYSGTTTINAGTLIFTGADGAAASSASFTVNYGGTLTLDNTSANNANAGGRIGDTVGITLNGGDFNFIGNGSVTVSETVGALTIGAGSNIITVTPGSGGPTIMTFDSFFRTAGATVLFRGTNLGDASAAGKSTIIFTTAPTLTGSGTNTAGTSTIWIIKGAFGDGSLTGTGTDMVTYNGGNGLRLLNGASYANEYVSTFATVNANVKLTTDTAAVTVSINSLILNGGGVTSASKTVTIGSGNILVITSNNIAGTNTTLAFSTNEGIIRAIGNSTISSKITGSGGLTTTGTGTITVSNTNSTYTGATTVTEGTFALGANAILDDTSALTIYGSTFSIASHDETVGAVTLKYGTISGSSGVLKGSSYTVESGTISAILGGTGALSKTSSGTVTLSGTNTYSGGTNLNAGTLNINSAKALGTSTFTIAAGTTIDNTSGSAITLTTNNPQVWNGNFTFIGTNNLNLDTGAVTLGNNRTITVNVNTLTVGGVISGSYSLTKTGAGTLVLSGTNTYTGITTITGGTLSISKDRNLGVVPGSTTATAITFNGSGATLQITNTFTLDPKRGITLTTDGAIDVTSGETLTYGGIITGNGALAKTGDGKLTLSGINTYAGGTTISAGTLSFASGSLSTSGNIIFTGGTLQYATSNTQDISGRIKDSTSAINIDTNGNDLTFASVIDNTNTCGLTKTGTGILTLSEDNDYSGTTTINAGTLSIADDSGLGIVPGSVTSDNLIFGGGTLQTTATFTLNSKRGITLNIGGGTINVASGTTLAYEGIITGSGAFTKIGDGALVLSGTNTYTGTTTISGGALGFSSISIIPSGNLILNGGVLATKGTFSRVLGTGNDQVQFGANGGGFSAYGGLLSITGFTGTPVWNDTGYFLKTGASLIFGDSMLSNNVVTWTNNFSLRAAARTITVNDNPSSANDYAVISGVISSTTTSGDIIKNGDGALVLSATNTYTGTTTISGGVLGFTSVSDIPSGNLILNGGVLATNGIFSRSLGSTGDNKVKFSANGGGFSAYGGALSITGLTGTPVWSRTTNFLPNGAPLIFGDSILSDNVVTWTNDFSLRNATRTITVSDNPSSANDYAVISGAISSSGTSGSIIKDGAGTLTLSGTNTYAGGTSINAGTLNIQNTSALSTGAVTIDSGATLDLRNYSWTAGTLTNNGTVKLEGIAAQSVPNITTGIVEYTGDGDTYIGLKAGYNYVTLKFSGSGTYTLDNSLNINGDLTIEGGIALDADEYDINIAGDWTNNGGIFNAGTGTVTFNGTGTITSGDSNFNNLTITGNYTQSDDLDITGDFDQTFGSFVSDPDDTFSVVGSFSISGGTFNRYTGSGTSFSPYLVYDVYGLQAMIGGLDKSYQLNNDINASVTSAWNTSTGFAPVGDSVINFTGTFDGNGKTITDLYINRPDDSYIGLFGYIDSDGQISDVGLVDADVSGYQYVGALAGYNGGTISNSYATGTVTGDAAYSYDIGGLVGYNEGTIENSYATGDVSGYEEVGGLVGYNSYEIYNSYATGTVTGDAADSYDIGGLVGYNEGTIENSYATCDVSGYEYIGGLVGYNNGGNISECAWYTGAYSDAIGYDDYAGDVVQRLSDYEYGYDVGVVGAFYSPAHSVYVGWDFTDTPVWNAYSDTYPRLDFESYGSPITVYRWTGESSDNWNDSGNWNTGSVPGSGDIVIIPDGAPFLVASITIGGIRIDEGASIDADDLSITVAGTWTSLGDFYNPGDVTLTGSCTINAGDNSFYNLTFSGGTYSLDNNLRVINDLRIESGTLDLAGYDLEVDNDFSNNGTLRLVGIEYVDFTNDTDSGLVEYYGTEDYYDEYDDYLVAGYEYYDLSFTGGGTYTLDENLDINGDLTIEGDSTLDASADAYSINIAGDWTNSGGTFIADTGTVTFDAKSGTVTITSNSSAFNNIDFNDFAGIVFRLLDDLDVNGNLTITNGELDANGHDITVTGDWTNNDTFTAGSSMVNFNGSSNQTISGTNTFNNVVINNRNSGTVSFTGSTAITGFTVDGSDAYNVSFTGSSNNFTDTVTFNNTGDLTLGDEAADDTLFDGGVDTGSNAVNMAGTVRANDTMTFGAVTLTGPVILNSNGNDINIASLTGGQDLILDAGIGPGTTTVTGDATNLGDGAGATITINSTGVTNFKGKLTTASGIIQDDGAGRVIFRGRVTIGAGDTPSTFNANVRLSDIIFTVNKAVTFGNSAADKLELTVNQVTIKALGTEGITFNSQVQGTQDLILNPGSGVATFNATVDIDGTLTKQGSGDVSFGNNSFSAAGLTVSKGTINNAALDNGIWTIAGNVDISSGTTLIATSGNFYIGGNWTNDGTFTNDEGTVTFNGSGEQTIISGGSAFYNLTNSNSSPSTLLLNDTLNVDGNLTIDSGSILDTQGKDINIYGNWNNEGVFNTSGGTVTFKETSQSDITGNNTFYNLTIDTTTDGAKTVRFGAGNTQTITNALVLTGADGSVLTIRSTGDGVQAILDILTNIASGVNYVDVKDNQIAGDNTITPNQDNSVDSGNNTNWIFNQNPNLPDSLGPSDVVDGDWINNNTLTLTFNLTDSDTGQQVQFQLQLDNNSDFLSLLIDYVSALGAQGAFNFTVGQAEGSGTYATGSQGQTLADSATGYYWRVQAIDSDNALSGWQEAGVVGTVDFKMDTVAPTITGAATPVANANGWNNTNVTVSYTVNDALSGVDDANPLTDYADDVLAGEGANQSTTGTVYDLAGNSASVTVTDINIDKTDPVITITSPENNTTYDTAQKLLYTTADNLDADPDMTGPASGTNYNIAATHNVSLTATDLAGNSSSRSLIFTIVVPAFTESQLSNVTAYRVILPTLGQLNIYQVNTITGAVYFYHPLTEMDMAAFDELIIENGAYQFMKDGSIGIVGHDRLIQIL